MQECSRRGLRHYPLELIPTPWPDGSFSLEQNSTLEIGGCVRTSNLEHRAPHALPAGCVDQELLDQRGNAIELGLGDDDRAARSFQVPGVLRLVIGGRMRIRDEHRRQPGGRELPDRAAGAGDRKIGSAVGGAEAMSPCGVAVRLESLRMFAPVPVMSTWSGGWAPPSSGAAGIAAVRFGTAAGPRMGEFGVVVSHW